MTCTTGHLDNRPRPAVAYLVVGDEMEPVCDECARALKALGHDIQPSLPQVLASEVGG